MDTEDLIIKKVRIKVWEDKHEIEDLTKLRKEILEFKENILEIRNINLINHLPKEILEEISNSDKKEIYLP